MTGWVWLAATGLLLAPRHRQAVMTALESRHRADKSAGPRSGRWWLLSLGLLVAGLLSGAPVMLLVVVLVGLLASWLRRRRMAVQPPDRRSIAQVLDLLAAAIATGAPPERAIASVAAAVDAHGSDGMRSACAPIALVGRLLQLGSDPVLAWSQLDHHPGLGTVGAAGRRCAHSGARLVGALAEAAEVLRAEHRSAALATAQRTGVWSLLPLGCCFLPAFACLGVLPVVIGVAGQVVSGG